MNDGDATRVTAVVVTRNRVALLRECLLALYSQSRPPDEVVVIDNASSDTTKSTLAREFPYATVVHLTENLGGAGGFKEGLRRAQAPGATWYWLLDDDTVAEPVALERLLQAATEAPKSPTVLASTVRWVDGSEHRMNAPKRRGGRSAAIGSSNTAPIRFATFVSVLIADRAVHEHGLPLADYYLWADDLEYTARLLRHSHGLQVLDSIVVHHTPRNASWLAAPPDRIYFHVRNTIWTLLRSNAFSLGERCIRAVRFSLGMGVYLARHATVAAAWHSSAKGVRDGVCTRPKG